VITSEVVYPLLVLVFVVVEVTGIAGIIVGAT
jgi:hypothetical protein